MSDRRSPQVRKLARESLGALVLVFFSAPAAMFSVFLTILKFRAEHRCDGFMQNACSSGCSAALSDAWSTFLDLPLSIYSAAFYAVLLGLGAVVGLGPPGFVAQARLPALALGGLGLVVSLALGVYSWLALGTWCELCTLLYLASLGTFLGACLLNPEGALAGLRSGLRRVDGVGATLFAVVLSAFFALVLAQRRVYLEFAAEAAADRASFTHLTCSEEQVRSLPESFLRLPAAGEPEVVAAVFVDLACPHCRRELEFWRSFQAERAGQLQVELFHLTSDPACGPLESPALQRNQSCNAALAAECLARMGGPDQLGRVTRLFAMQDGPSPYFTAERLDELFGAEAADLRECMNAPDTLRRVQRQIAFGVQLGLTEPPSTLIVPMAAGRPRGRPLAFRGGGKSPAFVDAALDEARARSHSDE